jgi:hypothetical protein
MKKILDTVIKPTTPEIDNKVKIVITNVIKLIKDKHLS